MYVHMYRYLRSCDDDDTVFVMISIYVCDAPSIPFFLLFRVIDFAFCLLLCEIAF